MSVLALLFVQSWAADPRAVLPPVQNRFFLKERRFELAPSFRYGPSDPFVYRYGLALTGAYHFSETLAAEGDISFNPDLGTGAGAIKPLLPTLVTIGGMGNGNFEQPFDKTTLAFSAAVRWSPIYGKINLFGETVLNCDVYGVAGLGMLSKQNYVAGPGEDSPLRIDALGNELQVAPVIGVGMHFFATQSLALGLDVRDAMYVDHRVDNDPSTVGPLDGTRRLYHDLTTSVGLSIFIPRMPARMKF